MAPDQFTSSNGDPTIKSWTTARFAAQCEDFLSNPRYGTPFAFVLGAGASKSSGIPLAGELAAKWLQRLHNHECECTKGPRCPDWFVERFRRRLHPADVTIVDYGELYTYVFEDYFYYFAEFGYACLRHEMSEAYPSIGYIILAQILAETDHKLVITTNFDSLVNHSISLFTNASAFQIVHEDLAPFATGRLRRPTIIKLHRDIDFNPLNLTSELRNLSPNWRARLDEWFDHYTPIFIGYGGNDWTLMKYLEKKRKFRNGLVWCRYKDASLSPRVSNVIRKHNGLVVDIEGFDELMVALIPSFGIQDVVQKNLIEASLQMKDCQEAVERILDKLANEGIDSGAIEVGDIEDIDQIPVAEVEQANEIPDGD